MNATNLDAIIIHYNEIALKGGNRHIFEQLLVESIKAHLSDLPNVSVQNVYGRILIKAGITAENKQILTERLKKVFGIASFAFARMVEQEIEVIKKTAIELIKYACLSLRGSISDRDNPRIFPQREDLHIQPQFYKIGAGLAMTAENTFKIETKRSDKGFKFNSMEISKIVGQAVVDELKLKVDINEPEITCSIELANKKAFIYLRVNKSLPQSLPFLRGGKGGDVCGDYYKGAGGLPTDSSAPMLGFLSGGIDSPAACFRLMRRGARVIFLHFHSYPQTSKASIDKVKELAEVLDHYQLDSKLYLIPFLEIQKRILMESKADLRVILYRRFMMRIANEIAKRENARAFITGENLGQVASQTAENMVVVEDAAEFPIFRPFIGYDKNEIIDEARGIGTYEISIRPYDDCCQVFMPEHPATKARLEDVEREESKLNVQTLVEEAVGNNEILSVRDRVIST